MEASHPDSGTLHAWIEGELDSAEHERIEAHVAQCADCREAVAEARGLIAGASRIVSALDGAPAGVVPSRHRFGARRQRFVPVRWAAAAAVLLFATTSVIVSREFRSRGIELPGADNETAAPSEEGFASTPASAPAAAPQQAPPGATDVAASRRSAATSAREPSATVSSEQARARAVRDGAVSDVQETRQVSQPVGAVALQEIVTAETDLTGKVAADRAGQIANAAPTPSAPAPAATPPPGMPAADARPSLERSRISGQQLSEVVITGAAVGPTGVPGARVVRVVRYEARPGVIVTLTEYEEPPRAGGRAIGVRGQARAQVVAAPPESQDMAAAAPSSGENSYTWRHPERGRLYVLRGPFPAAELESLARRLSELKVVR